MKNKKALTGIVAGVFLILVSIASATIIGVSVKNSALSLSPALSCADLRISSPIKITSGCFDSKSKMMEIKLSRDITDISKIESFGFSSKSKEWACSDLCGYGCKVPFPGEEKTYFIPSNENPVELIFKINSCELEKISLTEC